MMNLIILLLMAVLLLLFLNFTKDIISPPVILALVWMLPFLWLVVSEGVGTGGYDIDNMALYFVLGVVVFASGYFIGNPVIRKNIQKIEIADRRSMTELFKLFIAAEGLLTLYWFYDVYTFVLRNFRYNFWYTYKWNVSMGYYTDFFIIPYLRTASRIISCIMLIQFLSPGHNKKDTKWFWLQLIITAVLNLIGQGRGGIFSFLIPIAIIVIMMRRKSNAQTIKIGCAAIVVLLIVFVVYANMKSPYAASTSTSVIRTIENYLCGGVVAFVDWANESGHEYGFGLYTFRFLLAVVHAFGINVQVVPMVEEYVTNINGNVGNVYTFYKWYANDFGLVYAMLWQFIIGWLHGYITRNTYRKRTEIWLLIFATSYYPLVMQFFMDEYITKLSIWIQTGFWICLFLKTTLFYRNPDVET